MFNFIPYFQAQLEAIPFTARGQRKAGPVADAVTHSHEHILPYLQSSPAFSVN